MLKKLAIVALLVAAIPASAVVAIAQPAPQEVVSQPPVIIESQVTQPTVSPAPAVVEEGGADFSPFFKLLQDTLSAALLAVVTAGIAWLTAQISKLTAGRIKLDDLTKDIQMEGYARQAVDKALNYALTKTGYGYSDLQSVHVKPQIMQYAVDFLASQYPEVIKWVDTNENGVIDWVETHLPVPLQVEPQPTQQAFMANTPGKAPRKPRQPSAAPVSPAPDMA
jgi:hypothetical protein